MMSAERLDKSDKRGGAINALNSRIGVTKISRRLLREQG